VKQSSYAEKEAKKQKVQQKPLEEIKTSPAKEATE
jgi:hypothetical protein